MRPAATVGEPRSRLPRRTDPRSADRCFRNAVLVEFLLTEIFDFTHSRFAAVLELPFDVVVSALAHYRIARRTGPSPGAVTPGDVSTR